MGSLLGQRTDSAAATRRVADGALAVVLGFVALTALAGGGALVLGFFEPGAVGVLSPPHYRQGRR
jgi:hypothetical protein